jgi:hypothetical protein
LPVPSALEIGVNDDKHDEKIEVLAGDEVLDAISVDEGLSNEEHTNGNWD